MIKAFELADPNSCLNKAKDDEMVFVIRAKDPAAAATIQFWIEERIRIGKNFAEDAKIIQARADALTMEEQGRVIRFIEG
jgi:hypothetical protein